jgi:hypothetical protein
VVVRSLPFSFSAILQEKGRLGSYLQELSIDGRSKIERHLAVRENMIQELAICLQRSVSTMKKIIMSYEMASLDTLAYSQYAVKKLLFTYTVPQVKHSSSTTEERTRSLSLQIRFYSTHEPFVNKSYNLVHSLFSEVKSLVGGANTAPRPTKLKVLDV